MRNLNDKIEGRKRCRLLGQSPLRIGPWPGPKEKDGGKKKNTEKDERRRGSEGEKHGKEDEKKDS